MGGDSGDAATYSAEGGSEWDGLYRTVEANQDVTLCLRSRSLTDSESTLTVGVSFPVCFSSSCGEKIQELCVASVMGNEISITSQASYRERSNLAGCTADCRGLSARCETPTLAAGEYLLRHGDREMPISLPVDALELIPSDSRTYAVGSGDRTTACTTAGYYYVGDRWNRSADWNDLTEPTNPDLDRQGQGPETWFSEYVEGGTGLTGSEPWYARPRSKLDHFAQVLDSVGWTRDADHGLPAIVGFGLLHSQDDANRAFVPVVRWANPTWRLARLNLAGALSTWAENGTDLAEVVIALETPGTPVEPLFSATLTPDVPEPVAVIVDVEPLASLLVSVRGMGQAGMLWLRDSELTFTLSEPVP